MQWNITLSNLQATGASYVTIQTLDHMFQFVTFTASTVLQYVLLTTSLHSLYSTEVTWRRISGFAHRVDHPRTHPQMHQIRIQSIFLLENRGTSTSKSIFDIFMMPAASTLPHISILHTEGSWSKWLRTAVTDFINGNGQEDYSIIGPKIQSSCRVRMSIINNLHYQNFLTAQVHQRKHTGAGSKA